MKKASGVYLDWDATLCETGGKMFADAIEFLKKLTESKIPFYIISGRGNNTTHIETELANNNFDPDEIEIYTIPTLLTSKRIPQDLKTKLQDKRDKADFICWHANEKGHSLNSVLFIDDAESNIEKAKHKNINGIIVQPFRNYCEMPMPGFFNQVLEIAKDINKFAVYSSESLSDIMNEATPLIYDNNDDECCAWSCSIV